MGKDHKKKKDKKEKKHKKDKDHKRKRSRSRSRERESVEDVIARKRAEKERMKANETPEEQRRRRLEKKEKKRRKLEEQNTLFGYNNTDNRFGDQQLTTAFVWKKKYEKEIAQGMDPRKLTKERLREQQEELRREIEKVKERREQREREKAEMEALREQMDREKDLMDNLDWEEKEEEFHLKQAAMRSEIRIREGREKAIDLLAKNLNLFKSDEVVDANVPVDMDVELTEPYLIFEGLDLSELEDLHSGIKEHIRLGAHTDYWQALETVCEDEIGKAKALQELYRSNASVLQGPSGVHHAVVDEVEQTFVGKNTSELADLEKTIEAKVSGKDDSDVAVDVEYWEGLLKQLQIYKAKAFLHEFHEQLLEKRLAQLKEQHLSGFLQERQQEQGDQDEWEDDFEPELIPFDSKEAQEYMATENKGADAEEEEDGSFSPELMQETDEVDAVDPEEDARALEEQRMQVLEAKQQQAREVVERLRAASAAEASSDAAAAAAQYGLSQDDVSQERARGMDGDEEEFNVEAAVSQTPYWWHDKYRPRKPRFFNRVKTGFDWHKYNQAHYDKENPPPKVVQGYKFNIFYPDLIDKSKAPTFTITPDPDNVDYCTIRFSAGPPYEDLAFKIVHKPWEHGRRSGYKCAFNRGVLHLWFNFKKVFYRR